MDAVAAGLQDLQERQETFKKFGVRLHPEQDFSGTPIAPGTVPPIPQTEAAALKKHAAEVSRLKRKLQPDACRPLKAFIVFLTVFIEFLKRLLVLLGGSLLFLRFHGFLGAVSDFY